MHWLLLGSFFIFYIDISCFDFRKKNYTPFRRCSISSQNSTEIHPIADHFWYNVVTRKTTERQINKITHFFETVVFFQLILSILDRKNDAFYYRTESWVRWRGRERESKKQWSQINISNGLAFLQSRYADAVVAVIVVVVDDFFRLRWWSTYAP